VCIDEITIQIVLFATNSGYQKMKGNTLKKTTLLLIVLFFIIPMRSFSQVSYYGGKGLLRIIEAETIHPGILAINAVYNGYAAGDNYDFSEDHSMYLGLTVGLTEQFEILSQLVPYQDDQKHTWGPIGDTKLGVKYHIPNNSAYVKFGFVGFISIPTAVNHNVQFESYSDDAMGWGLMSLTSLDLKNLSSSIPLKLTINIGYRDHNWGDQFFAARKDQLIGGIGFKFPVRSNLLYSEVSGEYFINNTENVSPSQNFVRFTQGYRFVGPWHLICDLAADIELGGYKPDVKSKFQDPYIKDYADWKIIFGVSYRTTLFAGKTKAEKLQEEKAKLEQQELDTIQDKREKVIKDLEELRKQLEQEKKPNTN